MRTESFCTCPYNDCMLTMARLLVVASLLQPDPPCFSSPLLATSSMNQILQTRATAGTGSVRSPHLLTRCARSCAARMSSVCGSSECAAVDIAIVRERASAGIETVSERAGSAGITVAEWYGRKCRVGRCSLLRLWLLLLLWRNRICLEGWH